MIYHTVGFTFEMFNLPPNFYGEANLETLLKIILITCGNVSLIKFTAVQKLRHLGKGIVLIHPVVLCVCCH